MKVLSRLLVGVALALVATAGDTGHAGAQASSSHAFPMTPWLSWSTRAMGLGGAYQTGAARADAVFYFPSIVSGAGGFGSELQLWGGQGWAATVAAAGSWLGGTVALGVTSLRFTAPVEHWVEHCGSPSLATRVTGQEVLFDEDGVAASGFATLLGYGRELGPLELGWTVRLGEEHYAELLRRAPMLDLGISTEIGGLTLAVAAQNFGGQELDSSPRRLRAGVGGYGFEIGPFDLGVAGEISVADAWIPAAGVELAYWPVSGRTFVARAGVRRVTAGDDLPLTFGFSFWGDDLSLNWAFQPVEDAPGAGTHRFGIGWR